jgi:hypothetical protein
LLSVSDTKKRQKKQRHKGKRRGKNMILTDNEKALSLKFMADPALLQVYYFLQKSAAPNSMVRTTLRELEIGIGLDKMKIKRRLDWLAVEGHISIIRADRTGTVIALADDHNYNSAIHRKHKEAIEQHSSEAFKRLDPEAWAEAKNII